MEKLHSKSEIEVNEERKEDGIMNSEGKVSLDPIPEKDPQELFDMKVGRYQNVLTTLAYLYLTYQVVIIVCLTVYYYYQLDFYMPIAFIITVLICYLRSFTAFVSLKLAYKSIKREAIKDWKELKNIFYWTIVLIIIGLIIIMGIIPLKISNKVNIKLLNLLIINGIDFVLFSAMGFISMRFCLFLIKSSF